MGRRKRRRDGPRAATEPAHIAPETPEYMPTLALDWHIATARREMGESRWAELGAEWE